MCLSMSFWPYWVLNAHPKRKLRVKMKAISPEVLANIHLRRTLAPHQRRCKRVAFESVRVSAFWRSVSGSLPSSSRPSTHRSEIPPPEEALAPFLVNT